MKRLFLAAAITVLLSIVGTAVATQEEPLQAQSTARYTFGQSMHFSLRAKSLSGIHGATLFFNTPEMEGTYTVDFELDSSREIELEHEVPLTQVQLAPFTTVRYWWRLSTENGTQIVTEQTLDYVDDRFQWQTVQGDGVDVFWTGSQNTLGQTAIDVVAEVRTDMENLLAVPVQPLRIFIYPSMADLRSALRLTGRDWVGAEAMPELGLVLVTAVNERTAALDLGRSIPHELSHLMLYRATGMQYDNTPRWFDEGLATSWQITPDSANSVILQEALRNQATVPFAQLCASFPEGEDEVRLAYAQSAALIAFIRQEYGSGTLRELLSAFADGAGCDGGVMRVLGISLSELEARWLAQESPAPLLVHFLRTNGLWVALASGGFLIMGLLLVPFRRERK